MKPVSFKYTTDDLKFKLFQNNDDYNLQLGMQEVTDRKQKVRPDNKKTPVQRSVGYSTRAEPRKRQSQLKVHILPVV